MDLPPSFAITEQERSAYENHYNNIAQGKPTVNGKLYKTSI
jgi:hypothetical protein